MNGLFREVPRAISYLVMGVNEAVHEGCLEVTWYPKDGLYRRIVVPHYDVIHTLDRFCRKFVAATVVYGTLEDIGFVGAIQCRCDHTVRGACPSHCGHHLDRPAVHVIACAKDVPIDEEKRIKADAYCRSMIHKYLKEQHDIGFHPKHHHWHDEHDHSGLRTP
ncbi:MAG: hypothetical protein AMXMBFR84_40160 [Candidatus Hydrogenedentota bacterium]